MVFSKKIKKIYHLFDPNEKRHIKLLRNAQYEFEAHNVLFDDKWCGKWNIDDGDLRVLNLNIATAINMLVTQLKENDESISA